MMKKLSLLFVTLFCAISFCIHPFAIENSLTILSVEDIDVLFDENSSLTDEEKQIIAEYFANSKNGAQPYGLVCSIFGHKNSTEYVTTITHRVNPDIPRCLEEQWELTVCSRCDNVESRRIAFESIDCCPVD